MQAPGQSVLGGSLAHAAARFLSQIAAQLAVTSGTAPEPPEPAEPLAPAEPAWALVAPPESVPQLGTIAATTTLTKLLKG